MDLREGAFRVVRVRERLKRLVTVDDGQLYGEVEVGADSWAGTDGGPSAGGDGAEIERARPAARRRLLLRVQWRPLLRKVGARIAVVWIALAVMSVQAEMVVTGGLLDDPAELLFERAGGVAGEVRYAAWVELRGVSTARPPEELDLLRERVAAWIGTSARSGPEAGIAPLSDGWLLRVSEANGRKRSDFASRSGGVDLRQARGELLAALAAGERAMAAFPGAAERFLSRLSPRYWGVEIRGTMSEEQSALLTSIERVKRWATPLFQAAGGELVGVEWTPQGVRVLGVTRRLATRAAGRGTERGSGRGDADGDRANLEMRLRPRGDGTVEFTVLTRPELP